MSAEGASDSCSAEILAFSKANNHLAIHLYKSLSQGDQNIFISPFSISTALAMLFSGAEKETSAEMRSVLGYEVADIKDEKLSSCIQILLTELGKNQEEYTLACANSIVSHKNFPIKEDYKSKLEEFYKALLREVDFVKGSQEALLEINEWVKKQTCGKIPQLLEDLDSSTIMVLLNAVYFKGLWLHPFEKVATQKQSFYNQGIDENKKEVDMMHIKKSFPFYELESFQCLELPYKGDNIAMLILLPTARNELGCLEEKLKPDFINSLREKMCSRTVEVALPKFRLEYSKSLKENFQSLGIKHAFSPSANFSKITDSEGICVSEIIHKAVIEVNEEGTEAAAATAVMMARCCFMPVPNPQFIVDHPFFFALIDTTSDLIIFMGRVNEL